MKKIKICRRFGGIELKLFLSFHLKAWGECAPTVPTGAFQIIGRSLPTYWQEPSKDKEGSFERYERPLQGPLLINKQTGFVFVLLQGARMATQTNYWQDPSKIGRSL